MSTQERPSQVAAGPPPRGRPNQWRAVGATVVVLAVLLAVSGARRILPGLRNPFTPQTTDRSQPAVLKALEDLSEYRAASGHYQVIIDLEKDVRYVPSFIKGERTLFVAAGTVDAHVDFGRLGPDAVSVNENRTAVTIRLPHAVLSGARVEPARSYVYDRERGLVDRIGGAFGSDPGGTSERELYLLAEKKLVDAAGDGDVTGRAEENTTSMLTSLMRSLGFTTVDVTFG